jgi:tetratricopeptide (TPR) repeat protein
MTEFADQPITRLAAIDAVDPKLLSPNTRVEFEMTRVALGLRRSRLEDTIRGLLQERPAEEASTYLALVARLALLAADRGLIDSDWPLRVAREAIGTDPENPIARYQLAAALDVVGRKAEALEELLIAAADPVFGQTYEVLLALGSAYYNQGDYKAAADSYRRALSRGGTALGHLYLADTLGQVGRDVEAREHYRHALLLDPTSIDALGGYWFYVDREEVPAPRSQLFELIARAFSEAPTRPLNLNRWLRPLLWRLLLFRYRRHPEDARLHYMLGFTALLRGDVDLASERLAFIYEFTRPADVQALAILAVAQALQGRLDDADRSLTTLRDTRPIPGLEAPGIDWERFGLQQGRRQMVLSPFFWEPRLAGFEGARELFALIDRVFPRPSET